uniref:Uncharacterized protein n=1 Tax=Megaviridae environmental sample TaxID=1737588 RepID=A0A5J6VL71_9VIRU|nr:MAG: hypothetical protein [Megaviridae environmental sample]
MSHSKTKTVKKIHHPRLSSPKKKSLSPSKLIAKLFKGKTKKKLPSWYKETLPKVIRAKTKKRSNTKSLTPKNPFDKPLKTYNTFKKSLFPTWVGKIPYPKEVDYIPEQTQWASYATGVANIYNQIVWSKHLDLMKRKFKIPKTRDLWTDEQILKLKEFYMLYHPDKLEKFEKRWLNIFISERGPLKAKQMLIEYYGDFKRGSLKKIMEINPEPFEFTLKKNTILYHSSQHILPFHKIKFDSSSKTGFVFFGLSAVISIWYASEMYTAAARRAKKKFNAYLNVYRLDKDIKVKYVEDDISENQENTYNQPICKHHPCLHPQFGYHSYEQLATKRGPVDLDFELTLPINMLQGKSKLNIEPLGVYEIDVGELVEHSLENIEEYDPSSAVDFTNNLL